MAGRRGLSQDPLFLALLLGVLAAGAWQVWPRVSVRFAPARLSVHTALPRKVSLNRATLAELESLPGVGPKLARRIAEHRPYTRVEELLRVPGIGPRLLARIAPLVTP